MSSREGASAPFPKPPVVDFSAQVWEVRHEHLAVCVYDESTQEDRFYRIEVKRTVVDDSGKPCLTTSLRPEDVPYLARLLLEVHVWLKQSLAVSDTQEES